MPLKIVNFEHPKTLVFGCSKCRRSIFRSFFLNSGAQVYFNDFGLQTDFKLFWLAKPGLNTKELFVRLKTEFSSLAARNLFDISASVDL